ncbi:site-specific integrase [Sphingomonas crocodyli]|nr:site-specific integrase [Sphingomonas crocodyli]
MPTLTDDDIAALVKDFYGTIIAKNDDFRLMSDIPDTWREAKVRHYTEVAERARLDLASNAFGAVQDVTSVMLARRYGMDTNFDKLSIRKASQAMLRAGVDVAETLRARAEGDFNYEPKDKILVRALAEIEPFVSAPMPAPTPMSEPPTGPLFSVEAEGFREAQLRRKVWEQQTALQARKTYALFLEHGGDRPIAAYTRPEAAAFKRLLEDLPANYGKAAEFRGMKAADIVKACSGREIERLSSRTVQRHFAALASLWDLSIEQGHTADNIFLGWKFAAAKRARDQRQMWTREELAELFATPVWTGCQSSSRRSKPGDVILRDEKFWLPLIAVFSGMRQEEICQLRSADIRQVEGVWVFDLNTRDGQQLKNVNAVRLAPVHSELIRLGWLDYAEDQRRTGARMVFPGLQPGGADDRLGHNYSKWFTRYRRDVQLFATGRDFHSFRHSATTFMRRAGVPSETIDELTGHATVGETARYSKGLTVANLKEAVEAIEIGVDLSHLYPG